MKTKSVNVHPDLICGAIYSILVDDKKITMKAIKDEINRTVYVIYQKGQSELCPFSMSNYDNVLDGVGCTQRDEEELKDICEEWINKIYPPEIYPNIHTLKW